jgi:hypothetical protein
MRVKETPVYKLLKTLLMVPFLLVLSPVILLVLTVYWAFRLVLHALIILTWLPKGKDTLLVYSQSPIWHDYMTTQILPLVRDRAVVLDWSERKTWRKYSVPVPAFRLLGGYRNFNPLVIHFRPLRPALEFRFWTAFKDWKHGDKKAVEQLRQQLTSVLEDKS